MIGQTASLGAWAIGNSSADMIAAKAGDQSGKTAVITGGSSGIGLETARVLASTGMKVVIACRDPEKAQATLNGLGAADGRKSHFKVMKCDLASFRSIRDFANTVLHEEQRLDVLILNAAIQGCPQWPTREGFEYHTGVNYIGHFHLTKLLVEGLMLGQDMPSRVVFVTCRAVFEGSPKLAYNDLNFKSRPYSSNGAYAQSKLALAVFARELSSRLAATNVSCFIAHPGVAVTGINRWQGPLAILYNSMTAPFVKSLSQAAATVVHCALDPALDTKHNGKLFDSCKPVRTPDVINNTTLGSNLYRKTDELVERAVLDSHQLELNPGKVAWSRFWDLFVVPVLRALGLMRYHSEKQA